MSDLALKSANDAIGEMNAALLLLVQKQNEIMDKGFDISLTVEVSVSPRMGTMKKSKLEFKTT